jgi:putative hemolysin
LDEGSLGSLFLSLGIAGLLLAVAVLGVVRASLTAELRRIVPEHLGLTQPPLGNVEQLISLAPDPQITVGLLHLLLNLLAVFLTTLLGFSLGLNGWAMTLPFVLLLLVLLTIERTTQIIGTRYTERITPISIPLFRVLTIIVRPLATILPLERASIASRLFFDQLPSYQSPDSKSNGVSSPATNEVRMLLRGILNLELTQIREVLVPRVDIVAIEVEEASSRVVELALTHGYSRIPVYEGSIDQIVGIIYIRDLVWYLQEGTLNKITLRELIRSTMFVPESKRVYELLTEFQERRVHIAIVVDEYGGTAGLVTIEDLLEEIVGEIEDEFDREEPKLVRLAEGEAIVDARLSLDDLKDRFGVEIQGHGFDTVGGFVYSQLGRIPNPGDRFTASGVHTEVLSTTGRRIRKVKVSREE